jgi:predicted ArsR family transcriptional regulator
MSDRRAAVLDALRDAGGEITINDIAGRMSLHPNTVREHLDGLVETGMATRAAAPPGGRGRPAWRYRAAAPEERNVRIRDYVGLAGALARQVARSSTSPAADAEAAGADWGADLAPDRAGRTPVAVRREVVTILDELGFAPETDAEARDVRLRRCPLLDTAERYPDVVCSVHLGIVRGATAALGGDPADVELHPFAEPGACLLALGRSG